MRNQVPCNENGHKLKPLRRYAVTIVSAGTQLVWNLQFLVVRLAYRMEKPMTFI